jgi:hypothetical protein
LLSITVLAFSAIDNLLGPSEYSPIEYFLALG